MDYKYANADMIIKKVETMSLKYHKLSLLFNELAGSLKFDKKKCKTNAEFKKRFKEYGLDWEKLKGLSYDFVKEIKL